MTLIVLYSMALGLLIDEEWTRLLDADGVECYIRQYCFQYALRRGELLVQTSPDSDFPDRLNVRFAIHTDAKNRDERPLLRIYDALVTGSMEECDEPFAQAPWPHIQKAYYLPSQFSAQEQHWLCRGLEDIEFNDRPPFRNYHVPYGYPYMRLMPSGRRVCIVTWKEKMEWMCK